MTKANPTPAPQSEAGGALAGLGAYFLWGLLPLYFALLAPATPLEIVASRIVWSLIFCLILVFALKEWGTLKRVLSTKRSILLLALAACLIATNWLVYTFSVLNGQTVSAALGYFINPLAVVGFGVLVFREKLRPLQKVALIFGAAAVVVMVVAYGEFPWIALILTLTFGSYSLVKKLVGGKVRPIPGLAFETATTAPLALAFLVWVAWAGQTTVTPDGYGLLVASTGIVTAVPLLLFAVAARHLPMVALGMIQYLSPIWQFLIGWLVFREPMPPSRWAGFVLVWVAIVIFAVDVLRQGRRR